MSLSDHRVGATIAVADMSRTREFYEGRLGLSPGPMDEEGGVVYECGGGTTLLVYHSPEHAGRATATVATWEIPDLDQAVEELSSNGIAFEQYGAPIETDERGIHSMDGRRVAWFKDPDGNTIAVGEFRG
jgi:catechol 2,3-dioxygenase-like lactoylglutathione lyase family enzyme